ncbi:MAG: (5-formylfuran-3-yl)methyl phosphate synthase [Pirellulaceae bacterium]|nr:(5-formylfuran-3-yl)methyl phosphate synthase [Pirellulaceae bacterium]
MTGLLISVRTAAEAEIALAGGATLIDVKEPARGALGAADSQIWREVLAAVGGRVPASIAAGELLDANLLDRLPHCGGMTYAKFGLAGCGQLADWQTRWLDAAACLPAGVLPVAVIYADHERANSPAPRAILKFAQAAGCRAILVDTHGKSAGNLLQVLSWDDIAAIAAFAGDLNAPLVLAGSLDEASIRRLLPLSPDYVGVRGAACVGGRTGPLDLARVKSLASLVRGEREFAPPRRLTGGASAPY